jgi:hypothetical protein
MTHQFHFMPYEFHFMTEPTTILHVFQQARGVLGYIVD